MSEYTTGLWRVESVYDEHERGWYVLDGDADTPPGQSSAVALALGREEIARRRARLIAAAPTLIEAARAVLQQRDEDGSLAGLVPDLDALRAAVKSAEGGASR